MILKIHIINPHLRCSRRKCPPPHCESESCSLSSLLFLTSSLLSGRRHFHLLLPYPLPSNPVYFIHSRVGSPHSTSSPFFFLLSCFPSYLSVTIALISWWLFWLNSFRLVSLDFCSIFGKWLISLCFLT